MGAIIHTKSNAAGFQGNQGQGVGAGRQPQRVDDRAKKKSTQPTSIWALEPIWYIPEDEYPQQHAPKLTHISEPSTPSGYNSLQRSTSRQLNDTLVGDLAYKGKRLVGDVSDTSNLTIVIPMQTITHIRNATSVFEVHP